MSGMYASNSALHGQLAVTTTISILFLADLIGNTFVILIILTNKSMKSPMNYLLVNLAVSDIMVGTFFSLQYIFGDKFNLPDLLAGTMMCKLFTGGNFAWVGAVGSSVSLVAACFERYFAVVHPFSMKLKLTFEKVKKIVMFTWIFALVMNIPSFITTDYDLELGRCEEIWPAEHTWLAKAYSTVWTLLEGITPTTIMFVLYTRVIYDLWFKQNQVQGAQRAILKSRKRVTKMLVIISVIYAVCWLPDCIMYTLHHYGIHYSYVNSLCTMLLIMFNSAINPFIYSLQSEKFRRHLKALVSCKKLRQNQIRGTDFSASRTRAAALSENTKL
ncbi:trissin receptor-like [Actinia tenebrosa]|uniref:Trissin receptor-like n=1 Tax=Actinia tenebrosa TaxID=6105 RepID=A0A6P8INZ9_ACTTE|nr:trissin receptor-like [Actinia tenebrosa]